MNEQHLPKISPPTEPPSKNNGRQHKNIKITLPAEPKTKPNKNRGRKFQRRITPTNPISNRQNDQKFQSGYKGEAHIYEILISSMTLEERKDPKLLKNTSRKNRIIKGSGRSLKEYNQLVNEFEMMQKRLKEFSNKTKNGKFDPSMFGIE